VPQPSEQPADGGPDPDDASGHAVDRGGDGEDGSGPIGQLPGGVVTEPDDGDASIPEASAAPGPAPAPATPSSAPVEVSPAVPFAPIDLLGSVVGGAVSNVGLILRPEAALAVATEFTFPLVLALAVLIFIVAQHQVDRRDPKLRTAPQHAAETFVPFEPEEHL
jgi:hypothetical protein